MRPVLIRMHTLSELRFAVLLVFAVSPPFVAYAMETGIGAFRMFSAPRRIKIEMSAERDDGRKVRVSPSLLVPHLGRDARRVLVPAFRGSVGEHAVELIHGASVDIGEFVCSLDSELKVVHLRIREWSIEGAPLSERVDSVTCKK